MHPGTADLPSKSCGCKGCKWSYIGIYRYVYIHIYIGIYRVQGCSEDPYSELTVCNQECISSKGDPNQKEHLTYGRFGGRIFQQRSSGGYQRITGVAEGVLGVGVVLRNFRV